MLRITRRDFLKYCTIAAGALGLSATTLMKIDTAIAKTGGLPVIWMAGAACTGCSMTLLNSINFLTVDELLLNQIDLKYHDTVMATAGAYVNGVLYDGANPVYEAQQIYAGTGAFALVVEGAIPTASPTGGSHQGDHCRIGDLTGDGDETMYHNVRAFANHPNCAAVLAVGTCSSFGGIPGAKGASTVTAAKGVCYTGTANGGAVATATEARTRTGVAAKVFNVPGCPPHPDWIVGTLAAILADDTASLTNMTTYMRLRDYYGQYQCNAGPCPWRYNNTQNRKNANSNKDPLTVTDNSQAFAEPDWNRRYPQGDSKQLGREKWTGDAMGCLGILGCKGRKTKADCSARRWNADVSGEGGMNWCVGSRGNCQGCTEPAFPDKVGKFYTFA